MNLSDLFLRDDILYRNLLPQPPLQARNVMRTPTIPVPSTVPIPEPTTTTPTSEDQLKATVNRIKTSLKDKKRFKEAVPELLDTMNKHLTYQNKRLFYDALNIVSYRVGKPGFDAQLAKQLFDAALLKKECFSPGYLRNIEDWKRTVENLISGTTSTQSLSRNDGRFNTQRPPSTPANRRTSTSLNEFSELLFLQALLGANPFDNDYDSDEDEDENDSDSSPIPIPHHETLFIPPSYPFAKFINEPFILNPIRLKHTNEPTTFTFQFILSPQAIERKESVNISLCCFTADDFMHAIEPPKNILFQINNVNVDVQDKKGQLYMHGNNVSSLCKVGVNFLSIRSLVCCCSYSFGIKGVSVSSIEDLSSKVKVNNYEDSLKHVKSKFTSTSADSDIQEVTNSLRMTLKCPLSFTRIQTPVKGKQCQHIQCFDLSSYLSMNKNYPKFSCPVCSKPANYEDLSVDSFVVKILKEAPQEADELEIYPDGSWSQKQKGNVTTLKRKAPTPTTSTTTSPLPPQKIMDVRGTQSFSSHPMFGYPSSLMQFMSSNTLASPISPTNVIVKKENKTATTTTTMPKSPSKVFVDLTL